MTGLLVLTLLLAASFTLFKLRNHYSQPLRPPWLHVDKLYAPLRPDGREVFTSEALERGRVYHVTVTGTVPYWHWGIVPRQADAAYLMDGSDNFTVRHQCLEIEGQGKAEAWEEDRAAHIYSFLLDGTGRRQSLRLACPEGGSAQPLFYQAAVEPLMACFTLLPPGTPTVADRRTARQTPILERPNTEPPPRPTGVDLDIPACGVEVPSAVLRRGAVYRLRFSGTYESGGSGRADAVYHTQGSSDHFCSSYDGMRIDGEILRRQDSWQEDRKQHQYSCLVEGPGRRLQFRLAAPEDLKSAGGIRVNIEELPASTKTARMMEAEEAATAAKGPCQREALARERKVQELKRFVRCHYNFVDPLFRQGYISKYQEQILKDWRPVWTSEYQSLYSDSELVKALEEKAPEVLRWHEARVGMILAAERAMVISEKSSTDALPNRKITTSTQPYVSQCLTELFQFTEACDRERQKLAQDQNESEHRPVIDGLTRTTAFYYDQLARFGIKATTPEQAEAQYLKFCPPPPPDYYKSLMPRILAGEKISADPIRAKVEDLFREELKLTQHRKQAVERKNSRERYSIDERLIAVRSESAEFRAFLESIGYEVVFEDYREQEPSLVEEFLRLHREKAEIKKVLEEEGDEEAAEHVDALYAQERAKLFDRENDNYT